MGERTLSINVVTDGKVISVPYTKSVTTAEDVCINVCKQLTIGTVARHLFALRVPGKHIFLMSGATFSEKQSQYDFRIRFKVANIKKLKKVDVKAYDYYFYQARSDVLDNKIADILSDKYKDELLGLGITDMYRVMLEKEIPREAVLNEYKKYIPKEALKRHFIFLIKPIRQTLGQIYRPEHDSWYVKAEYLRQFERMAPEYLAEEYKALVDENGSVSNVIVRVSPFHATEPGIKYCYESRKEKWHQICTLEDLGFVSLRQDGTVEISRKNGIPFYLKFSNVPIMYSFVSLVDGYYRLTLKWTFNICRDVSTPSLQKLYTMKCHGPIGGEFSYAKLEEKRGNHPGCFILRESESKYNVYYIDVCVKDSLKPKTFKLERLSGDHQFIFNDDLKKYKDIQQLTKAYSDKDGPIYLAECLPPSEYDKSPLLLCQSDSLQGDSLTDSSSVETITSNPLCINSRDLQVYKGQKKEGSENVTVVYRGMWRHTKGKKIEVAMKILKQESRDKYLKDFLDLAGQWAFLHSSAIVKLYGVTLSSQLSLVLEYVRLGPLNQYLRENKADIKPVDLIEAASNVASALWHLEENGIVHGNIRCRKLLLHRHDENAFIVKLSDPGIHSTYASKEVHWIPIECYSNLEFAKRSTPADVWAFGTTLWEIFTYGEAIKHGDHIEAMKFYASGKRLPRPTSCPTEIYDLMKECWDYDPHRRKQPQAIMRDINQILYGVYNSRKVHSYAKLNKSFSNSINEAGSSLSVNSVGTDKTCLVSELLPVSAMSKDGGDLSGSNFLHKGWLSQDNINDPDALSCNFSAILSNFSFSTATTSLDSINSIQSIFELDDNCNVVLQGKIGQGFYGEVYKGTLEIIGDKNSEPRQVAVKKLKKTALSSCLQDFEREISIMKTLKHPNIVEILGVLQEPEISLVMEFVQHGSLQNYLKIYRESLSVQQLLKYALDIATGMDYLGKKNIVHRDLAARNILVVDETHVKISDFGLAQVIDANDYYILKTNRELPIKWYAPESLQDGKFSTRSDVWSFGVTMCEMFSYGEEPKLTVMDNDSKKVEGQEQQILLSALQRGARFPCPSMCPQAVYVSIIYSCWEHDPHSRPTFAKLCNEIKDIHT